MLFVFISWGGKEWKKFREIFLSGMHDENHMSDVSFNKVRVHRISLLKILEYTFPSVTVLMNSLYENWIKNIWLASYMISAIKIMLI